MLKLSVTERLVLDVMEYAFDTQLSDGWWYHIIKNKKYGAMAYDLFTPNLCLEIPGGQITITPEEKTECWKTSVQMSKYILKDKWTKEKAVEYYKSGLLCMIMRNAVFHGWTYLVVVPEERNGDHISVQFYEKKYEKQIMELCKDKAKLRELCI